MGVKIGLGLGALLIVGAFALLFTPYSTHPRLSDSTVQCKSPAADKLTSGPRSNWYDYDPRHPNRYPRGYGPICEPASNQRLLGAGAAGALGILTLSGAGVAWSRTPRWAPTPPATS